MKRSRLAALAALASAGLAASTMAVGLAPAAADAATTAAPAAECTVTDFTSLGDITDTVEGFREALGDFNAPEPVAQLDGRRQINWDAAPAAISDPNEFPGAFFNFGAAPRARGIEFTTPGTGFLLSGDLDDGTPIEFESINPQYRDEFTTFSPERLFTPIGSNVVDVRFFSPADQVTPATVDGFGAVFTDVDFAGSATIEYFDADGNLLHTVTSTGAEGSETLEFLGAKFDANCVFSVKITAGNTPLSPAVNDGEPVDDGPAVADIVAMDDFIYGEPTVLCLGHLPTIIADGSPVVTGTSGDDVILGSGAGEVIRGLGGDDVLCGEGGDDTLIGGAGHDRMNGGEGADDIRGSVGVDTVDYSDSAAPVRIAMNLQADDGVAGEGDRVDLSIENAIGSAYNDVLLGSDQPNTLNGGPGDDLISGRGDNDRLIGGPGTDVLRGGAGDADLCRGSAGLDHYRQCEIVQP